MSARYLRKDDGTMVEILEFHLEQLKLHIQNIISFPHTSNI